MKKYICVFLTFVVLLMVCACSEQNTTEGGTISTESTETQSEFSSDIKNKNGEINHNKKGDTFNKEDHTNADGTTMVTQSTPAQSDENGTTAVKPGGFEKMNESNPSVRRITDDTPGHAGVNMRSKPDSASDLIMVIPEDTDVRILDETVVGGYYKIEVRADGKTYTGYVMARYVSTFSGASFDSVVSNTPNRAGAPLHKERSGRSNVIMTVPEGSQVRVWDQDNTEEYYSVDVSIDGAVYSGFMQSKYIEYAG